MGRVAGLPQPVPALHALKEPVAAMQTLRDPEGLALSANRWSMRGQVTRGGNQHSRRRRISFTQVVLPERSLNRLNGMEVAILAQQCSTERGEQRPAIRPCAKVTCHELSRFVDLLLAIHTLEQSGQELLRLVA